MEESFNEKVVLLIIENGLLALIIVLVVFFLNRLLERFKSKLEMNSEIVKLRLGSMERTLSVIYSWVVESNKSFKHFPKEERERSYNEIKMNLWATLEEIEKNKFLNGELFTEDVIKYCGKFDYYFQCLRTGQEHPKDFYKNTRKQSIDIIKDFKKYLE